MGMILRHGESPAFGHVFDVDTLHETAQRAIAGRNGLEHIDINLFGYGLCRTVGHAEYAQVTAMSTSKAEELQRCGIRGSRLPVGIE